MMTENAQKHTDIGEIRDIFKGQGLFCEKRRDHQRQCRVLGAGNPYDAIEFLATDDTNPIQQIPLFKKALKSLRGGTALVMPPPFEGPLCAVSSRAAAAPACF